MFQLVFLFAIWKKNFVIYAVHKLFCILLLDEVYLRSTHLSNVG